MRDLLFLAVAAILLFMTIKRPFVGIAIWIWTGLFVPVYWLYSFAEGISYNTAFAVCTGLGFVLSNNKPSFSWDRLFILVLLLFAYTTLTSATALGYPDLVWGEWDLFMKVILLVVMISLIIRKRAHFELLCWALALSVGFYGVVEGLKFISSGGGHQIQGPLGHLLKDNNHLAIGLATVLPIMVYLAGETRHRFFQIGIYFAIGIAVLAILGTHSRGGFIALLAVGGYFWLKSQHKLLSSIAFILVFSIAMIYLPDSWFERIQSIESMELLQEDNSFMQRVVSWKVHAAMALDRPLLGGGFKGPLYGFVWRDMLQHIYLFDFIPTPPPRTSGLAAHSIYFQILGDHGIVAFGIYITIMLGSLRRLSMIERLVSEEIGKLDWRWRLARMMRVSLITFAVGGGSVSLAYLEIYWVLIGMVIALSISIKPLQQKVTEREKLKGKLDHPPRRQTPNVAMSTRANRK